VSINIWLILGRELSMLCGKTAKIIYKINLYCLWFAEFSLYCNKDMCGLLNFHFIVIRTYIWLAEFSLYYNEDMCMACWIWLAVFFVLDICMACCLFRAGYGLLFFFAI